MLGGHRKGYLITRQGMESDRQRKSFPKEVISKLRTKRQVRICPAEAGGDRSRNDSVCRGPRAKPLVHVVKHKKWEDRGRTCRPQNIGR